MKSAHVRHCPRMGFRENAISGADLGAESWWEDDGCLIWLCVKGWNRFGGLDWAIELGPECSADLREKVCGG